MEIKGHNDHPRIDQYASLVLDKKIKNSQPWCGYFVGFVLLEAGLHDKIKAVKTKGRAQEWFNDKRKIVWKNGQEVRINRPPQTGDLVGYKFRSGRISHIGIIIEWDDTKSYFISIEGNTSWRNAIDRDAGVNDGVRLKKRSKDSAYIVADWIG